MSLNRVLGSVAAAVLVALAAQCVATHPGRHPRPPLTTPGPLDAPRPRWAGLDRLLTRLDARTAAPPKDSYEDSFEDDEDEYDDEEDENDSLEQEDRRPHLSPQKDEGRWDHGMSPYSASKWETLGSRTAVEQARRHHLQHGQSSRTHSQTDGMQETLQHVRRINRESECRVPKPRLVRVTDVYPHPSKTYFPHCTLLHQCSDDTGCCHADTLACVAKRSHRVDLYFYTTTSAGGAGGNRVEKLTFYNHTECMCEDVMPKDVVTRRSLWPDRGLFRKSCRCPSEYTARYLRDGACSCDCFDKQRECIRFKRGKTFISPHDRKCILTQECEVPQCEFGAYLRKAGRCPRKREKFAAWSLHSGPFVH